MGYEYSYGVEGGGEVDWCTAILLVHLERLPTSPSTRHDGGPMSESKKYMYPQSKQKE